MSLGKEDSEQLRQLEESLWRSEDRFDREYMDTILSPDFFEFGRSGRIYSREQILQTTPGKIDIKLPLKDFKIHLIDRNIVLLTYISEVTYGGLEVSNRSSIWIKTTVGWQLRFHQGTQVRS